MHHFIDGTQADLGRAHAERLFEGLARVVGDDLAGSQGVIDRAPHRAKARRPSDEIAIGFTDEEASLLAGINISSPVGV